MGVEIDVRAYTRFVTRIAMHLSATAGLPVSVQIDDLVQEGMLGLISAAQSFTFTGGEFETFAYSRVRGAMLDALREQDWVPRQQRKHLKTAGRCRASLEQELGRHATPAEVAQALGISIERFLAIRAAPVLVTLDEEPLDTDIADYSLEPSRLLEDKQAALRALRIIERLSANERTALRLRCEDELPLHAVGAAMGVSESRACQLVTTAMTKLRKRAT